MNLEKAEIEKAEIDRAGREIILTCPSCRETVEAKENYRFNGSAKIAHTVSINCDCGYSETFSKGLDK